jgi:cytochrome P450
VTSPVLFDPSAPGFLEDPYPHYAQLRDADPVHEHPMGVWFLWRHADAEALHRSGVSVDERPVGRNPLIPAYQELSGGRLPRADGLSMLDRDPPDHTRLRRLVGRAFTARTVGGLEAHVTRLVTDRLEAIAEAGRTELIGDLAFPLPVLVISEMLGLPADATPRIRELTHAVLRSMEPVTDPAVVARLVAADDELSALLAEAVAAKRRSPGDDLLSALIAVEGEGLSAAELVAQTLLLFVAGHETTTNLIGNGTLALVRHPEQLALLGRRPDLGANAVEELLRYDSPVQLGRRITVEPYEVGGRTIPPRTFVSPAIGAANRDPARWGPNADTVRIDRDDARGHLSFGSGIHHCLGAALARLEGRVFFTELARRFARVALDGQPVRNGLINQRGLDALPLVVTSR